MQRKHWIFIAIIILAFLAGTFVWPNYFNKSVDSLNAKMPFLHLPHFWSRPYVLGLDLQGGVNLTYQADLSTVEDKSEAMSGLRDVIERRVNLFGVSEPVVQIQGEDRLMVSLPGVKDVKAAIEMIGQTPYLEFSEQRSEQEAQEILDKISQVQKAQEEGKDISQIENWELALQNPYFKPTELTGKYLSKATVVFDQTTYRPQLQLQFNSEGEKIFEQMTGNNIGKPLAIFLDNQLLQMPTVQEKISGGRAQITGRFTPAEAKEVVERFNAGALPAPIT